MFIYLSKKVAIPPSTKINALAWNKQDGYIAVGGDNGLLKVLKLDGGNENEMGVKTKGLSARSSLSMNETLEGHTENIRVITWNEPFKRLTTSDENGVIVVWMLYKGTWCEEMINNRKKSTVADMAWSRDGKKICIVYEDGGVILGSVDGNRIWGKELKGTGLSKVQWTPDDGYLLFGMKDGSLQMYTKDGDFFKNVRVRLPPLSDDVNLVALDWYPGKQIDIAGPCKALAVCYENNYIQLMQDQFDEKPTEISLTKNKSVVHARWNDTGSLLAIAIKINENGKDVNAVKFFNPYGEHLRTLRVPGQSVSCVDWEGGSLRIALSIDSFVYFANVRPDYKWCYFNRTLAYASDRPKKRSGVCVCFWNMDTYQYNLKYLPRLIDIAGGTEACALAARMPNQINETSVIVCNTNGTVVEGYLFYFDVRYLTMNHNRVILAGKYTFVIWHYTTPKNYFHTVRHTKFKAFDIDNETPLKVIEKKGNVHIDGVKQYSDDCITCIASSTNYLLIGRQSGVIHQHSLPDGVLLTKHTVSPRPYKLFLNRVGSRAAVIDANGLFQLLNISKLHATEESRMKLERRDVWSMCWSTDAPTSFAIMEKTRMYVFKGEEPEEPITSTGYIFNFENLEIKAVMMDEVMENPEEPSKKHILHQEVKSLRDTRNLMKEVGITEAKKFIEDNPHPRLWKQLAEGALHKLDLETAEYAFIRSENYPGILLIKKLQKMPNSKLHNAFISLFLREFDKAEKFFIEMDRADLALNFRQTIGDWFRVVELIKTVYNDDHALLITTYNHIGDYFADKYYWQTALDYYQRANNMEKIIECYGHLKDFKALKDIMSKMKEGDPLLAKIAKKFAAEDVYPDVVNAYKMMGQIDLAKQYCVRNNRWSGAFELATGYNVEGIPELFEKFVEGLVNRKRIKEAINEYAKASHFKEAGQLCFKVSAFKLFASYKLNALKERSGLDWVQKLYAYGGHMYWLHYSRKGIDPQKHPKFIWRSAEACFYLIKAAKNTPINSANAYESMCLGIKLLDYVDVVPAIEVYLYLAIAAYRCQHYGVCSKAFVKLQRLTNIDNKLKEKITKWSFDIFKNWEPNNLGVKTKMCKHCGNEIEAWNTACPECRTPFKICVLTGVPLISEELDVWTCKMCSNCAITTNIKTWKACPVCGVELKQNNNVPE